MNAIDVSRQRNTADAYVALGSAALHAQMEELFGLPETEDDIQEVEVFGPYLIDGTQHFWRHCPRTSAWSVLIAPDHPRSLWVDETTDAAAALLAAYDAVRVCPPRGLPDDPNTKATGAPFVFEGWRFRWVFYPELARWELAPGGRA